MRGKAIYFVMVGFGALLCAAILMRSSIVPSPSTQDRPDAAVPEEHNGGRSRSEDAAGPSTRPPELGVLETPITEEFRKRARVHWESIRSLVTELFLSADSVQIPPEERRRRLESALRERHDPAVLAAMVIGASKGGHVEKRQEQWRSFLWDALVNDSTLGKLAKDPELLHFLLDAAFEEASSSAGHYMAASILEVHAEGLWARRPKSLSSAAMPLGEEEMGIVCEGVRRGVAFNDLDMVDMLVRIVGAYARVSPIAQREFKRLLATPPSDPKVRSRLVNVMYCHGNSLVEDPTAFRFLLSCIQDKNDQFLAFSAVNSLVASEPIMGGNVNEANVVLTSLTEQYNWSRLPGADGQPQGSYLKYLETIASVDLEGAVNVVRESLADSTLERTSKLRLLKRIEAVTSGRYGKHRYLRTASTLSAAIESVQPDFAQDPELSKWAAICLARLGEAKTGFER